jgi:hypothetical protein
MKMEQIVSKRWHLNYRRQWITQKKAYNMNFVVIKIENFNTIMTKGEKTFPNWSISYVPP